MHRHPAFAIALAGASIATLVLPARFAKVSVQFDF
jgi:hypothetical protein